MRFVCLLSLTLAFQSRVAEGFTMPRLHSNSQRCILRVVDQATTRTSQLYSQSSDSATEQEIGEVNTSSLTTTAAANDDEATTTTTKTKEEETDAITAALYMPLTFNEVVRQAASAISDAYEQNFTRQVIRVVLPRDPESGQLGRYFENDAGLDTNDLLLVPPDESWQGGIMQLYRAAFPTCRAILKRLSKYEGGLPPKIVEDRSIDESGVDGVGLLMTQGLNPADDISCFIQPIQETVNSIESISSQAGERLVLLANPQWRNVDDILDTASRDTGAVGFLASFLGGKGNSLRRLNDLGYKDVYSIEGYVCKGGNIRIIKRFDSDYAVFAENDSATAFIRIGSSKKRPTYQDVFDMLSSERIGYKFERDFGWEPFI